jgi:competence protein ComEA
VSLFTSLGSRPSAEQTAIAHERLRSLVSSALTANPWAPAADAADEDVRGPDPTPAPHRDWPTRLRISPAAVVGVVMVLVVAVVAASVLAWRGRARDVGAQLAPPQPPQAASTSPLGATGRVVVDVAGKVRRPGLISLPAGSRVADALRAAGGAKPGTDLTSLNLARKLIDGEQIVVGAPGAAAPTSGAPGPTNPVDLNTASVDQLDQLPGVGPVLAQRIVDWRTAHGSFTAVSQLRQVTGIGDSKYADLQPLVRV